MHRAVVPVCLLLVLAGCAGPTLGPEAKPAGVPDDALRAAGYVGPAPAPVPVVYPVGVGPATVNLTVTGYATVYVPVSATNGTNASNPSAPGGSPVPPAAADGDATGPNVTASGTTALFVLSTPNADVAGMSVNPFAHATDPRVLDAADRALAAPGVADVALPANLTRVGETERRVLGTPTRVVTYAGGPTNASDGTEAGVGSNASDGTDAVLLHVATVEHGDDVVVLLALHDARPDEAGALFDLMERVEHPVEAGNWSTAAPGAAVRSTVTGAERAPGRPNVAR